MEDKPEKQDLPTLLRKAYLTWNEVDGLLFHHAFKRNLHGNYKWAESLKNARKGVRDLFEEALLPTGELKGESSTRGNTPIYRKIKKEEMCAWLMEKRILGLVKDRGIEVPVKNVKFIEETAKEIPEPEPAPQPQVEPTEDGPENSFKPDGQDNWRINFKGEELSLIKGSDGMRYISLILEKKEPIPSEQLYRFCKMVEQGEERVDETFFDKDKKLFGIATQHPKDPTMDGAYLKDLKDAKKELEEGIDAIKKADYLGNDLLEVELYKKEDQLKKINDHLSKNTRPDKKTGKTKPTDFASEAKKASGKIHHALKTAYNNILKESPDLVEHLKSAIKSKDNQFSYKPPKENHIVWEVILK
jgi:hypothetical protein